MGGGNGVVLPLRLSPSPAKAWARCERRADRTRQRHPGLSTRERCKERKRIEDDHRAEPHAVFLRGYKPLSSRPQLLLRPLLKPPLQTPSLSTPALLRGNRPVFMEGPHYTTAPPVNCQSMAC